MHNILKILIASVLALGSVGDEGWYPVEREREAVKPYVENDPSIWVLFFKDLGVEKLRVRFPDAPAYRSLEDGGLEVAASRGRDLFVLTVREAGQAEEDRHYPEEGRWIHEHFAQTAHHLFHFKAITDQPDSPHFSAFISSLSIEENH